MKTVRREVSLLDLSRQFLRLIMFFNKILMTHHNLIQVELSEFKEINQIEIFQRGRGCNVFITDAFINQMFLLLY